VGIDLGIIDLSGASKSENVTEPENAHKPIKVRQNP